MLDLFVQLLGGLLVVFILFDAFATVLSINNLRGPIGRYFGRFFWAVLRSLDDRRLFGGGWVSLCGPLLVITTLAIWSAGLLLGFALFYWPLLGSGIESSRGSPHLTFTAALYFSGYTLSTLGLGDLFPVTPLARALTVLQAWLGFTLLTLTISYITAIYEALRERNHFAATLDALSGGTGETAEVFARIENDPSRNTLLHDLRDGIVGTMMAHNQYPVIHYFAIPHPRCSTVLVLFLLCDYVALRRAQGGPADPSLESLKSALQECLDRSLRAVPFRYSQTVAEQAATQTVWREQVEEAFERWQEWRNGPAELRPDHAAYVAERKTWEAQLQALSKYFLGDGFS